MPRVSEEYLNARRAQIIDAAHRVCLRKPVSMVTMTDIINDNDNNGRSTHLGEIGSKINARFPDFDSRDYGYSTLSKMVEETDGFTLTKKGTAYYVALESVEAKGDVYAFARDVVIKAGPNGMNISELSNQLHTKYPSFSPKAYGYSQFQKFVSSIPGAVLYNEDYGKRVVIEA